MSDPRSGVDLTRLWRFGWREAVRRHVTAFSAAPAPSSPLLLGDHDHCCWPIQCACRHSFSSSTIHPAHLQRICARCLHCRHKPAPPSTLEHHIPCAVPWPSNTLRAFSETELKTQNTVVIERTWRVVTLQLYEVQASGCGRTVTPYIAGASGPRSEQAGSSLSIVA